MQFFNKKYLANAIIKNRLLSIVGSLFFMLFLGIGSQYLTFDPDLESFFPENHPATQLNNEIDETFIPTDNIIIAIDGRGTSIFKKRTLDLIERLTELSWTIPHSVRVDSLTNFSYVRSEADDLLVEPFIENALSLSDGYIEERSKIVETQDAIFGSIISKDKETTVISIVIDPPGEDQAARLTETIEHILNFLQLELPKYQELDIRLLGNPYQEYISPRLVQTEMPYILPLMIILIFLSVFFLLRSTYAVFATLGVVVCSVVANFGSIGWIGNSLNQMIITYPILVITLALADCVHLFTIYFQERAKEVSSRNAMIRSLELNLQPLFLTTITTCIGFLSFNVLEIEPLRNLGNGIAIGVGLAFIFTIFLIAPLTSYFDISPPKTISGQTAIANKIAKFSLKNGKKLIWIVPAISLILICLIPLNNLDENPTQMYSDRFTSFAPDTIWLDERMGVTFPVSFKATSPTGNVSSPKFLNQVDEFTEWLEGLDEVNHVTSLATTMKTLNRSMHGDDDNWKIIPENEDLASQYLFFYEMSLPLGLDLNSSISQDRGTIKIASSLKDMSSKEYLSFSEKVDDYLVTNNLLDTISPPAGFRVVFTFINEVIVNNLLVGVFLGLILITLILGLFYRSFVFGIISSFPNVLPIGTAFGIWALVNGNVGFMVAVGMGSTLGIIVDFTVHLLSKYDLARTELQKSPEESIIYSFEAVGFPLIIMTVVLSIGFLALTLVSFKPLGDFARFSSIAFMTALFIDFFLFPQLLVRFDKRKLN